MKIDEIHELEEALKLFKSYEISWSCPSEDLVIQEAFINQFLDGLKDEFQIFCSMKPELKSKKMNYELIEDVLWEFVGQIPGKLEKQMEREAEMVVFYGNADNISALENVFDQLKCRKQWENILSLIRHMVLVDYSCQKVHLLTILIV